jgi:hypothetical protein
VFSARPPCSIGFGTGLGLAAALGSFRGMHLVVPDIIAACAGLTERGVDVTEVRYMDQGSWVPGPDPRRRDYMHFADFADFADPDGNGWVLQEVRRDGAGAGR